MLLTVDAGNTNVLMGLYDSSKLKAHWRLASKLSRTPDEWGMMLIIQAERFNISPENIEDVIISSVVPALDPVLERMSVNYLKAKPVFIKGDIDLSIKILYEEPKNVGSDRLCNAVAGYEKYGGPLIIIDFGTATTYDVVLKDGSYLGGIISPGIETASETLHLRAAKLPLVEQKFPKNVIGMNTEESIQSGIMYGSVLQIEGFINLIRKELDTDIKVIATGGFSEIIRDKTKAIDYFEPYLTLEGLNILYNKLKRS